MAFPRPVHKKQMSKLREIFSSFALMFAGLCGALLLAEGAVRLMEPREVMRYFFMRSDPVLDHSFIPNSSGHYKTTEFDVEYRINSLGLREHEISRTKPAGTRRVLMLGDSFTEGDGVDHDATFSHRLQTMLDTTKLGSRWEVINAGVGSYAPSLEFLYLRHGGLDLSPDIVVLNLDLSDFFDDIHYAQRTRYDARGVPVATGPEVEHRPDSRLEAGLLDIKDFFKDHTRLYNFIRLRIDRYLEGARHTVDMSGNIGVDKYAMLRPEYGGFIERDGAMTFHNLYMIRDTLRARGIDFHVTLYPYGLQVGPTEWTAGRKFWGFRPDSVYSITPQFMIEQILTRNGIEVTNLSEPFRELGRQTSPLYHDYNGHWLPAGHALVARELYARLLPLLKAKDRR
jgi:hypothetical protein